MTPMPARHLATTAREQTADSQLIAVDEDSTINWEGPGVNESAYPSGTLRVRLKYIEEAPVSVPSEE